MSEEREAQSGRLTLTVEEAGEALGIGRNLAYDAVRSGQIPVVRIGKRLLVPRTALEKLLSQATGTVAGSAR